MIAYKGFHQDLTCTLGKGTFQYKEGETIKEEKSKCASSGSHCAENPFDCFCYYPLGNHNRYFMVEAAGSIDEDGNDTKIACTEMTLLKELTIKQMAGYGMVFMVKYPKREWKQNRTHLQIQEDIAEGSTKDSIAIARGNNPKVKGVKGSIIGLVEEHKEIVGARLLEVDGKEIKEKTWYTLENGNLKEKADEA